MNKLKDNEGSCEVIEIVNNVCIKKLIIEDFQMIKNIYPLYLSEVCCANHENLIYVNHVQDIPFQINILESPFSHWENFIFLIRAVLKGLIHLKKI